MRDKDKEIKKSALYTGVIALVIVIALTILYPLYNVWASEQSGRAALANAEYSKQVAVEDARAKLDSSNLLAKAEVERAIGVAEANKIIGDSLKNNEAYLRYLWISQLDTGQKQVLYVPTEANIPILEAGKRVIEDVQ